MIERLKSSILSVTLTLMLGIGIGYGLFGTTQTAHSQSITTDSESQLFHTIYQRTNPSVVSINVRLPGASTGNGNGGQNSPFSPNGPNGNGNGTQYAAGSGFVYDTAGHIVTNAHVVDGADQIEVTFSDGTMMHAKTVGIDIDSDIAVIQVTGDSSKYPALAIADSDALQVGDRAIAIGNPFENAGTMTQGIVSGLHRLVDGLNGNYSIPDVIQTDAAINPGNSGGPLLNADGLVIGVNEQIASNVRQSSGVSFSIPSNLVKQVADGLIKDGKYEHTYLGIAGGTVTLDVIDTLKLPDNTHGAFITQVQTGSPAAQAGLKAGTRKATLQGVSTVLGGDIIIAVDGHPVRQFEDLTAYLFEHTHVGQMITLTIVRGGQQQDVQVTLAARPAPTTAAQNG